MTTENKTTQTISFKSNATDDIELQAIDVLNQAVDYYKERMPHYELDLVLKYVTDHYQVNL